MKRLTLIPLLMLLAGSLLMGCAPKQEEPTTTPTTPAKAAPTANPQKQGASAPDQAVAAPPGVQTGTP